MLEQSKAPERMRIPTVLLPGGPVVYPLFYPMTVVLRDAFLACQKAKQLKMVVELHQPRF
jgi:hypothetical protein